MDEMDDLVDRVLDCANRVSGTALSLPPDGDLPLEAFGFDSLSAFAFILELEATCGFEFDDALLDPQVGRSVRSVAALIASDSRSGSEAFREGPSPHVLRPDHREDVP
jgi:acyl carrier protein